MPASKRLSMNSSMQRGEALMHKFAGDLKAIQKFKSLACSLFVQA